MTVSPNDLILVAALKAPRDLEIARVLGWYRIPLRTAPKVIAVDYLAFYQTAAFGEEKWRIQYVAPVRGHELTIRGELLHEQVNDPRAQEEYFKIQLGPLEKLPQPILAPSWRRITFFYTTGEYMLHAETVNQLVVESEERQVLWRALRERASRTGNYAAADDLDIDLDPQILSALLGIRELEESYEPDGSEE